MTPGAGIPPPGADFRTPAGNPTWRAVALVQRMARAVLPSLSMELVMISACRVERPEEFEQRVVRLQTEFAAGDAATRRRLLQPPHAKERFENYDPTPPSLSNPHSPLLFPTHQAS